MVDAIRLARRQIGVWMVAPAVISWAGLFGYQWAFSLSYRGSMPTVFNYLSGVLGDGILIPAANVLAYSLLRQLRPVIRWQRLPLYAALGFITAYAAFMAQAGLGITNWSMPAPYQWSAVGQFHFFVLWAEVSYLYTAFGMSMNNWATLRSDLVAWRSFWAAWFAMALFGLSLAIDVMRFTHS
ncbi:MAG TPA: hypothetical protein VGV88_05365 [Candidatus Dormibacteraeota bacterium]|nr:hypothetical protein [Candidatus Dormibacteraeota bacterium]